MSAAGGGNESLYLGLGIGIGGLLLIAIVVVVVQIVRKTRQHGRSDRTLEQGQNVTTEIRQSSDLRRTLSLGRRLSTPLEPDRAPWNPLASTETLAAQDVVVKKRMPSLRMMKKPKHGIPLRQLKHLSAITESPRSRAAASPMVPTPEQPEMKMGHDSWPVVATKSTVEGPATVWKVAEATASTGELSTASADDVPTSDLSERMDALLLDNRPKAPRSVSMSALIGATTNGAASTTTHRHKKHTRSASLGASPPEHLPPDPTLPVISPHDARRDEQGTRPHSIPSSISSEDSASSSVLVVSPGYRRHADPNQTPKPGMRPAYRNSIQQTPLLQKNFSAPLYLPATDPERARSSHVSNDGKRELASMDSNSSLDQYGVTRSASNLSTRSRAKRAKLSPSLSVSSSRKASQFSVSADGSPSAKKRAGVLQDISGNASTISRQSSTIQHSPTSSEGNPFQWDLVMMQKPSAMKGSPNARKGHKRQNCVRISTLTPQVLGPPPSRPESPSITHRIDEEGMDENGRAQDGDLPFVTNRRPSRPNSSIGLGANLRVQTLRASLTPSSPTASIWAAFQENGLPSQSSDSHLTASSTDLYGRPLSAVSSNFSIPSFPSPSRATLTEVQRDQPIPEFSLSRSLDDDRSPSPLGPEDAGVRLSSTPPSPIASAALYDPAWLPYGSQGFTTSGAALKDVSPSKSRLRTPVHEEKLTSSNASAIMAQMPSELFSNAPLLRPTMDQASSTGSSPFESPDRGGATTPPKQMSSSHSYGNLLADHPMASNSPTSPAGPRDEPPRSVLRNAMALRRMNSQIETAGDRSSRRYMKFGRESSPHLPYDSSPEPSEAGSAFDGAFHTPPAERATSKSTPTSHKKIPGSTQTYPKSILKNRLEQTEQVRPIPNFSGRIPHSPSPTRMSKHMSSPHSLYDADGFLRSQY